MADQEKKPNQQLRLGIVNAYNYWIELIQPNWVDLTLSQET